MDDPICETFLFADKVIQEKNGKYGVIGIFDRYTLSDFPSRPVPHWWVFVVVRNIEMGKHEFALTLLKEQSQQVIVPVNGEINIEDKARGISLALPMPPVSFPKPGQHLVTFHVDGTFVAQKTLTVDATTQ